MQISRRHLIKAIAAASGGSLIGQQAFKGNNSANLPPTPYADWNPALIAGAIAGDPISTLPEAIGARNATAATTARPAYQIGAKGQPVLRFDGAANIMRSPAFTIAQPYTLCLCVSTIGTGGGRIVDGNTVNQFIVNRYLDANQYSLYAGSAFGPSNPGFGPGAVTPLIATFNGASSELIVGRNALACSPGSNNTAGGICFGAAGNSSSFANVDLHRAILYNRLLSPAEKRQVGDYFNRSYGALTSPVSQLVYCEGDSLTYGTGSTSPGGSTSYPGLLAAYLGGAWTVTNAGVSGKTLICPVGTNACSVNQGMAFDQTAIKLLNTSVQRQRMICVLWGGTNDLLYTDTAANVISHISSFCSDVRSAGIKVIVATVLPRNNVSLPANFETSRQTVNASVRANWSTYADALADIGNDPTIGQAGQTSNATYYNADTTHLVDAGYAYVNTNYIQPAVLALA